MHAASTTKLVETNPIEAAMVVAVCIEMEEEPEDSEQSPKDQSIDQSTESKEGRRTVRRRSAAS